MKKTKTRLLAMALVAALVLSGCGVKTNTEGVKTDSGSGAEIKNLVYPRTASRELETFNILYSQRVEDSENLTNLYDGLLEADSYGRLTPGIAKEWKTEDNGLNWTFKIRDGVKWVDMNGEEKADCNAWDFATGLEWVLNFHKNDSSNTSMPIEMIKGAKEYYEYTKSLSAEEAKALRADTGSKFLEMVGIQIPDDLTLIYTCITEKPYFATLGLYSCFYPASQALIDELGVDGFKAMDNTSMWYNGCYTMTSYIQGNEKVFTKNPKYWDQDCKLFDTVTIKMVESTDVAFQLYQAGELDFVLLTESNLNTISSNESNEFHDQISEYLKSKTSFQFHINYDKRNPDGSPDTNFNTAAANEAFRLAWYYGLDLTSYYKRTNALNPLKCENNFYTMSGLVYTSDGKDYTELVRERIGLGQPDGKKMTRYNKEKAQAYKEQAIEELSALGVTFPIIMDYYIPASSQTALDTANVLKQAFSDSLGDDFTVLNIKTYVSSITKEVSDPKLQSFVINGWGADYGDPQNFLGQEAYGKDNAWYAGHYSNINHITEETPENKALLEAYKEFTSLVEAADKIYDDMDKRYEAYADAEAYLLSHALVIPATYEIPWCLTHINTYSMMNAIYGIVNDKMKNWETSVDAYTTEQMNAFAEEYAKGAQ